MNTIDQVKEKASTMELRGVNFLDEDRNWCGKNSPSNKPCQSVELIFIDGEKMELSFYDFNNLGDFEFHLRPARDN